MSLSELNLHPQQVQASYPGCANPTTSSTDEEPGAYSEANAQALGKPPLGEDGPKGQDSAKIIEGAEIAPLGEGKIADDPSVTSSASTQTSGLVEKATEVAKQAYTAVVGESK